MGWALTKLARPRGRGRHRLGTGIFGGELIPLFVPFSSFTVFGAFPIFRLLALL